MKNKLIIKILPILGILLILIGYFYFTFETIKKQNEIKSLNEIKRTLINDSIRLKEEITSLNEDKSVLLNTKNELTKITNKLNNTLITSKVNEINNSTKTELNVINSKFEAKINNINLATENIYTIYIQVNDKESKARMQKIGLIEKLQQYSKKYKVYGYDVEENRAHNDIKYFHKEDTTVVNVIIKQLLKIDNTLELKPSYVRGFELKAPKHQIELWIK